MPPARPKHNDIDRDALRADWRTDAQGFGLSVDMLDRGQIGSQTGGKVQDSGRDQLRALPEDRITPPPQSDERFASLKSWMGSILRGQQSTPEAREDRPENPGSCFLSRAH